MSRSGIVNELCVSCVFHPPNLPAHAYPEEDYRMLQEMNCSFDFQPGDENCHATRKTSCSLVALENLKQPDECRGFDDENCS